MRRCTARPTEQGLLELLRVTPVVCSNNLVRGPAAAYRRNVTSDSYPRPRFPQVSRRQLGVSSSIQTRGKKTKTTVSLADLPQGPLVPPTPTPPAPSVSAEDAVAEENEGPAYPTVVLQARRNMQKFENCVLLTRVGGFYELYFQHAEEYGPLLNIKVAQKKTSAGLVPMVNYLQPFPMHHPLFTGPSLDNEKEHYPNYDPFFIRLASPSSS